MDISKKPFYISVTGKSSNALDKFNKRVDSIAFSTDEDNNIVQHFRRLVNVVIDQYTSDMRVEISLRIADAAASVENEARSVEFSIKPL